VIKKLRASLKAGFTLTLGWVGGGLFTKRQQ
jgi:hypothetical protein